MVRLPRIWNRATHLIDDHVRRQHTQSDVLKPIETVLIDYKLQKGKVWTTLTIIISTYVRESIKSQIYSNKLGSIDGHFVLKGAKSRQ
jgi:hypothetical protein